MFEREPYDSGFTATGKQRLCKEMDISVFCLASTIAEIGIESSRRKRQP
jgi:hypothetical protein